MQKSFLLALTVSILGIASSANASTLTFQLTQDACTGGCGTAPFGTIVISDNGTGAGAFVTVTETLASGERFAGTGAGSALGFNLAGTDTVTNLTTGFSYLPTATSFSAFGSFLKAISCTACHGGQAGNPAGPLTFNIGSSTGVTTAMFTLNTGGYSFASDIVGTTGNTGNVAALAGTVATPEPGTVGTLLSAFVLLGIGAFRRKTVR